jgi:hypothetical protein
MTAVASREKQGFGKGGVITMRNPGTTIRFRQTLLVASARRVSLWALLAAMTLAAAGCDETPTLPEGPAKAPSGGNQAAAPSLATSDPSTAAPGTAAPAAASAPATPQVADGGQAGGSTEKAMRGVGAKGSTYGGGIITEPVRQYWLLRDAAVFEIQIPSAINLFHAEHNRFPKDLAEFRREILEPASIKLPELREGDEYDYDSKTGELLVRHPATEADRAALNQK